MRYGDAALIKEELERKGQSPKKNEYKWFYQLKKTVECIDCGQSFPDCPQVIQFHHNNGHKTSSLAVLIASNQPDEKVWAEIQKCIPLCANCHIKRHHRGKR
jgi:hypothetical protein